MFADGHPCCAPQPKLRSKNMYAPFTQLVPNDELTDEVRHAVLCPALLRLAMYAHGPANPASLQAIIPALTLILHPRSYPALPRCLLSWRGRGAPAAWRSSSAAWTSSPSAPCRQAAGWLAACLLLPSCPMPDQRLHGRQCCALLPRPLKPPPPIMPVRFTRLHISPHPPHLHTSTLHRRPSSRARTRSWPTTPSRWGWGEAGA